jgi:hypothetical protein
MIDGRLQRGALLRIGAGVYAVGHCALTQKSRWMAAVLACGPQAFLSHRSAAVLHGLITLQADPLDVVTTSSRSGRTRPGICAHAMKLAASDVATVAGIPCTTVSRTLVDLAAVMPRRQVARAFDEAQVLGVLDLDAIAEALDSGSRRRGFATLRSILAEHRPGSTLTRSELEERFLALVAKAGIPEPLSNQRIRVSGRRRVEVDFVWPAERLVVETDGLYTHITRRSFEHDRRRDVALTTAGWRVVRFTWRQVTVEEAATIAALRRLFCQVAPPRARVANLPPPQ